VIFIKIYFANGTLRCDDTKRQTLQINRDRNKLFLPFTQYNMRQGWFSGVRSFLFRSSTWHSSLREPKKTFNAWLPCDRFKSARNLAFKNPLTPLKTTWRELLLKNLALQFCIVRHLYHSFDRIYYHRNPRSRISMYTTY
jgi:hypothetical protein